MLSVLKLGSKKTPSSSESSTPVSETRRNQLRLAQRRHRNRKEAYQEALRKEVTVLRRNCRIKQQENLNLRRYLKQHLGLDDGAIDVVSDASGIESSVPDQPSSTISNFSSPSTQLWTVERGQDDQGVSYQLTSTTPGTPEDAEYMLGVNWVLGLERACFDHMHLLADPNGSHSHQVMSQLIDVAPVDITAQQSTQLSDQEISLVNLLHLSSAFNLEEELTPVQAWFILKEQGRSTPLGVECLQSLQKILLSTVKCHGFGAVIDKATFAKHSAGIFKE